MSRKLFTDSVLAKIPEWVNKDALTPADIAGKVGCTVGTLRVQCCRNKISLRRVRVTVDQQRGVGTVDRPTEVISLCLSTETHRRLRKRAKMRGISALALIAALIEAIEKDDLYDAVLDDRGEADYASTRALI